MIATISAFLTLGSLPEQAHGQSDTYRTWLRISQKKSARPSETDESAGVKLGSCDWDDKKHGRPPTFAGEGNILSAAQMDSLYSAKVQNYLNSVALNLGVNEHAFEWLARAFEERADRLVYLNVEPLFGPLRSDPRFQQLMRQYRK